VLLELLELLEEVELATEFDVKAGDNVEGKELVGDVLETLELLETLRLKEFEGLEVGVVELLDTEAGSKDGEFELVLELELLAVELDPDAGSTVDWPDVEELELLSELTLLGNLDVELDPLNDEDEEEVDADIGPTIDWADELELVLEELKVVLELLEVTETIVGELEVELELLEVVETMQLDAVKYEVEQSVGDCLFPIGSEHDTVLEMHGSLLLDVVEAEAVGRVELLDVVIPHPDIVE
jgi:hypothetical protein